MADEKKTKSKAPRGKRARGHLPTKKDINLAVIGEEHINALVALPSILLILLAAALFSKFLVYDRMQEVSAAWREVSRLQSQLDAGYEELADYAELAELYAHYTFSGMTEEEKERIDRVEVLSLIDRLILPQAGVEDLAINGNTMTLNMSGNTLQEINLLVQKLEADPVVDFCSVTTAVSKGENNAPVEYDENTIVTARVIVYLKSTSEIEAETAQEAGSGVEAA